MSELEMEPLDGLDGEDEKFFHPYMAPLRMENTVIDFDIQNLQKLLVENNKNFPVEKIANNVRDHYLDSSRLIKRAFGKKIEDDFQMFNWGLTLTMDMGLATDKLELLLNVYAKKLPRRITAPDFERIIKEHSSWRKIRDRREKTAKWLDLTASYKIHTYRKDGYPDTIGKRQFHTILDVTEIELDLDVVRLTRDIRRADRYSNKLHMLLLDDPLIKGNFTAEIGQMLQDENPEDNERLRDFQSRVASEEELYGAIEQAEVDERMRRAYEQKEQLEEQRRLARIDKEEKRKALKKADEDAKAAKLARLAAIKADREAWEAQKAEQARKEEREAREAKQKAKRDEILQQELEYQDAEARTVAVAAREAEKVRLADEAAKEAALLNDSKYAHLSPEERIRAEAADRLSEHRRQKDLERRRLLEETRKYAESQLALRNARELGTRAKIPAVSDAPFPDDVGVRHSTSASANEPKKRKLTKSSTALKEDDIRRAPKHSSSTDVLDKLLRGGARPSSANNGKKRAASPEGEGPLPAVLDAEAELADKARNRADLAEKRRQQKDDEEILRVERSRAKLRAEEEARIQQIEIAAKRKEERDLERIERRQREEDMRIAKLEEQLRIKAEREDRVAESRALRKLEDERLAELAAQDAMRKANPTSAERNDSDNAERAQAVVIKRKAAADAKREAVKMKASAIQAEQIAKRELLSTVLKNNTLTKPQMAKRNKIGQKASAFSGAEIGGSVEKSENGRDVMISEEDLDALFPPAIDADNSVDQDQSAAISVEQSHSPHTTSEAFDQRSPLEESDNGYMFSELNDLSQEIVLKSTQTMDVGPADSHYADTLLGLEVGPDTIVSSDIQPSCTEVLAARVLETDGLASAWPEAEVDASSEVSLSIHDDTERKALSGAHTVSTMDIDPEEEPAISYPDHDISVSESDAFVVAAMQAAALEAAALEIAVLEAAALEAAALEATALEIAVLETAALEAAALEAADFEAAALDVAESTILAEHKYEDSSNEKDRCEFATDVSSQSSRDNIPTDDATNISHDPQVDSTFLESASSSGHRAEDTKSDRDDDDKVVAGLREFHVSTDDVSTADEDAFIRAVEEHKLSEEMERQAKLEDEFRDTDRSALDKHNVQATMNDAAYIENTPRSTLESRRSSKTSAVSLPAFEVVNHENFSRPVTALNMDDIRLMPSYEIDLYVPKSADGTLRLNLREDNDGEDSGIFFHGFKKGSAAELLPEGERLVAHDEILSIAGVNVESGSLQNVVTALQAHTGDSVNMRVRRHHVNLGEILYEGRVPEVTAEVAASPERLRELGLPDSVRALREYPAEILVVDVSKSEDGTLRLLWSSIAEEDSHVQPLVLSAFLPDSAAAFQDVLRLGDELLYVNDYDIEGGTAEDLAHVLSTAESVSKPFVTMHLRRHHAELGAHIATHQQLDTAAYLESAPAHVILDGLVSRPNIPSIGELRALPCDTIETIVPKSADGTLRINLRHDDEGDMHGLFIHGFKPNSAAEAHGVVRLGDELIQIDGKNVEGQFLNSVVSVLQAHRGDSISMVLRRHQLSHNLGSPRGQIQSSRLDISPRFSATPVMTARSEHEVFHIHDKVQRITDTALSELSLFPAVDIDLVVPKSGDGTLRLYIRHDDEGDAHGLFVHGFKPNSAAERQGLIKPGDELIAVDGAVVKGQYLQDLVEVLQVHQGAAVKMTIRRHIMEDADSLLEEMISHEFAAEKLAMGRLVEERRILMEKEREAEITEQLAKAQEELNAAIAAAAELKEGEEDTPEIIARKAERKKQLDTLILDQKRQRQQRMEKEAEERLSKARAMPNSLLTDKAIAIAEKSKPWTDFDCVVPKTNGELRLHVKYSHKKGLFLHGFKPGSLAEAQGILMQGDELLSVDGCDVHGKGLPVLVSILKEHSADKVNMRFRRHKFKL